MTEFGHQKQIYGSVFIEYDHFRKSPVKWDPEKSMFYQFYLLQDDQNSVSNMPKKHPGG